MDKDCVLSYIDKLYQTLSHVWSNISYILIFQSILCILLIAASTGVFRVNAEEIQLQTGVVDFMVPLHTVLIGGAVAVVILFHSLCSQVLYAHTLRDEIWTRYREIGFSQPSRSEKRVDAFEAPNVFYSIIVQIVDLAESRNVILRWYNRLISMVMTSVLITVVLPVGAEIAVGRRVAQLFNWRWWTGLLFVLPLIIVILLSIARYVHEGPVEEQIRNR